MNKGLANNLELRNGKFSNYFQRKCTTICTEFRNST